MTGVDPVEACGVAGVLAFGVELPGSIAVGVLASTVETLDTGSAVDGDSMLDVVVAASSDCLHQLTRSVAVGD